MSGKVGIERFEEGNELAQVVNSRQMNAEQDRVTFYNTGRVSER